MNTNMTSMIYLMIFIILIFFVVTGFKNTIKYKKENMKVLLNLNQDDKRMRTISIGLMSFMIFASVFLISGVIQAKAYGYEELLTMVVLPILMIALYIPLSKKTRVSNLGIHKRSYLIRWDAIKGVNYLKPNEKNIIKVKVMYNNGTREASIDLAFSKDDGQLETFKEIVKEYRNSKKGKKSGK
ncbi:MAG: hypothetical protein ACERLG_09185 [Sedimentibacter sp.]